MRNKANQRFPDGVTNALREVMIATIVLGFFLFLILAVFTLVTNPPSAWVGKNGGKTDTK